MGLSKFYSWSEINIYTHTQEAEVIPHLEPSWFMVKQKQKPHQSKTDKKIVIMSKLSSFIYFSAGVFLKWGEGMRE